MKMIIRHITIRDFGSVRFYDTGLIPELNIIDSRCVPEVSAAIALFLCSKAQQAIFPDWIRPTTHLTAEVLIEACEYTVTAMPSEGRLTLTVMDNSGTDVTEDYQYILSHCLEQDALGTFDGQDKTLPMRLRWYRNCEDATTDVSPRTECRTDLKTFRSHLIEYMKAFRPEPINCAKDYFVTMNREGQFEVFHPGISGDLCLSETEEKLFLYTCFLNVAEFWTDIEKIRNLHHEKKPLVIQNFLEFLDASTNLCGLIARTIRLQRQIIILTQNLNEDIKKIERENFLWDTFLT